MVPDEEMSTGQKDIVLPMCVSLLQMSLNLVKVPKRSVLAVSLIYIPEPCTVVAGT